MAKPNTGHAVDPRVNVFYPACAAAGIVIVADDASGA